MTDGLLIATLALMKHTPEPIHEYVLTASIKTSKKQYKPISAETVQKLDARMRAEKHGNSIQLIDITDLFNKQKPTANMETMFTPYCMLRLYADQLPQLPDRLLYLDTDVVCRRNPLPFYEQDMQGTELVGVLDYYGKWFFHSELRLTDYLNSGVLLLNLAEIRRTGLFARCRQLCTTRRMFMPDQTALNHLAATKRIANRRYNDQRRLHPDTVFQHFTTSFRWWPWLHTQTVKPWEVDRVHNTLKLHEYDDVLAQYTAIAPELHERDHDSRTIKN